MRASLMFLYCETCTKSQKKCPETTTFEERRAEAEPNRGPSAYQPKALPLGQTGSRAFWFINVTLVQQQGYDDEVMLNVLGCRLTY